MTRWVAASLVVDSRKFEIERPPQMFYPISHTECMYYMFSTTSTCDTFCISGVICKVQGTTQSTAACSVEPHYVIKCSGDDSVEPQTSEFDNALKILSQNGALSTTWKVWKGQPNVARPILSFIQLFQQNKIRYMMYDRLYIDDN